LQKVVIIPKMLNGQLASSGFYGIRFKNYEEACLFWSIFRSNIIQKQFIHLASGYTQRELNDEYLEKYLLIPLPKKQSGLIQVVLENIEKAKEARRNEIEAINIIKTKPEQEVL